MSQWEYKIIVQERQLIKDGVFDRGTVTWEPGIAFKELGIDGWELVSVAPVSHHAGEVSGGTHRLHHYFKRQLN